MSRELCLQKCLASNPPSSGWVADLVQALPPEIVGAILTGGAVLLFQVIRDRVSHARYREKMALTHHSRLLSIQTYYRRLHNCGSLDRHINEINSNDISHFHEFMAGLARARLDLRDARQFLMSVRDKHELGDLLEVMGLFDKIEEFLISDGSRIRSRIDGQLSVLLRNIVTDGSMDIEWLNTAFIEGLLHERVSGLSDIGDITSRLAQKIVTLENLSPSTISDFEKENSDRNSSLSVSDFLPNGRYKQYLIELKATLNSAHPLRGLLRLSLTPLERVMLNLDPHQKNNAKHDQDHRNETN